MEPMITLVPFAIIAIAMTMLQAYMLAYVVHLEKLGCECAMDWRRNYIMWYLVFSIALTFINLFMGFVLRKPLPIGVGALSTLASIMFIVFALQYVHRLKKEKCECSVGTARDVLQVVAIIDVVLLGLVVLAALTLVGILVFVSDSVATVKGNSAGSAAMARR